jgi:hypothetical protein
MPKVVRSSVFIGDEYQFLLIIFGWDGVFLLSFGAGLRQPFRAQPAKTGAPTILHLFVEVCLGA